MSLLVYEPPANVGIQDLEGPLPAVVSSIRSAVSGTALPPVGPYHPTRERKPPNCTAKAGGCPTSAVILTGAGGAIGQSIARRISEEGRRVVCVDRDERVLDVCDELDDVVPCVVDLTADDAPGRVLPAAEEGGGAAVLVNNAGITRDGRALKLDLDDFRLVIRVNLVAPLRLAEAVAPRLSDGGSIINIASRAALGNFGQANYVAAKSALVGATRALAVQWAPVSASTRSRLGWWTPP